MRLGTGIITFLFLAGLAASAGAQVPPNPELWSHATNPNGMRIVPSVWYEPDFGILFLDTRGLDGEVNAQGNATIAGDDVGMIAIIVGRGDLVPLPPFDGLDLAQGIFWNCGAGFSCQYGLTGTPLSNEHNFLVPGVYSVFQLSRGLSSSDFGAVEMAVNFAAGQPSAVLEGRVVVVPEPHGGWCLGLCLAWLTLHPPGRVKTIYRRKCWLAIVIPLTMAPTIPAKP